MLGLSYISLLESIADDDRAQINQTCEQNLYKAFSEGMSELNYNVKEIKVMNNEAEMISSTMDLLIDELFDMEVIDV